MDLWTQELNKQLRPFTNRLGVMVLKDTDNGCQLVVRDTGRVVVRLGLYPSIEDIVQKLSKKGA